MRPNWPNTVVSGSRAIASDITQVRDLINTVRDTVGLSAIAWPALTTMKAGDLVQMRNALQEVWDRRRFGTIPNWSTHTPTADATTANTSLARHLMDLRIWAARPADYPPLQGVDTFSWNQYGNPDFWAIVTGDWRANITGLTPQQVPDGNRVQAVRCLLSAHKTTGAQDNPQRTPLSQDPEWRERIETALGIYTSANPALRVYVVINAETYYTSTDGSGSPIRVPLRPPSDPLQDGPVQIHNTNDYIEAFSNEVAYIVGWLSAQGVQDFIIWNEPNDAGTPAPLKLMSSGHYAAMLRRCWRKVMLTSQGWRPAAQRPNLYWGGVLFTGIDTAGGPESGISYLEGVYDAADAQRLADPPELQDPERSLPWTGINVHLHHIPRNDVLETIFKDHIWEKQMQYGDGNVVLVGEWGVTKHDLNVDTVDPNKGRGPDALKDAFLNIRRWVSVMFYFKHPDYLERAPEDDNPPPPEHVEEYRQYLISVAKRTWGLVGHDVVPGSSSAVRAAGSDTDRGGPFRTALRTNPP